MNKEKILVALKQNLQIAVLLEASTLPPYLCAYWSIYSDSPDAERVKNFLLSVIREEMLHMAMACNILNALGGSPVLNNPDLMPQYPCVLPGHSKTNHPFQVHLNKCCPQAIANFIQIELPETMISTRHNADGWCTIGEFYDDIKILLKNNELEDKDFSYGKQLAATYNPGNGKLFTVSNKQDALAALDEIIDQGEGHAGNLYDNDHKLTHYWRFKAIYDLMLDEIWNYNEEVFDMAIDPDEACFSNEARVISNTFNSLYSELFDAMQNAFTSDQPSFNRAIDIMFLLKEPAIKLMSIPLSGKPGNAGPTFKYLKPNDRNIK